MKSIRFFLLIPIFFILAACNAQTADTPESVAVTLQLSWVHEYSSSMFHAAAKEGYFAANGLDVTLNEGGFGENGFVDPIGRVVAGEAAFGFAEAFTIIQARNNGQPVVGLATILQRSPVAILSLPERNFQRPQDLSGHTITIAEGGATMLFNTLLDTQAIAADTVTIVPRVAFGIEPVLNGDVDSMLGWITNEGVALEEAGQTPNYMLLSDYGIESYNTVLFTTEEMLTNNPEAVQAMVKSIQEGIEFVVGNPQAAIDHTMEYAPDLDKDAQLRRLQASIPLMNVPNVPFASMEADVWDFQATLLREQGLIDEDFDVTTAFTLDFISTDN